MIPFTLMQITDGTTTLNLNDNLSYGVDSFDPVVASRQRSQLAAGGPYKTVVQPLTINVIGDTPTAAWDNLTKLLRLLDQGEDWFRDQPVSAVRLRVQALTTTTLVEAYILGQAGDDDSLAGLSPEQETLPFGGFRYVLRNVALSFRRTGVWEATIDAQVNSGAATNPGIMTMSYTSTNNNYSRIRVRVAKTGAVDGGIRQNNYAYLLMASASTKLAVIDSVTFGTVAGTTETADAGADAFGGSVKRIQANTTEINIAANSGPSNLQRRVGFFAAVRNNSATATFYLRAEATDSEGTPIRTGYTTIDTSTTLPRIVYLGQCTNRYDQFALATSRIYISASLTDVAQTLDIDYVAMITLDDPWSDRVIVTGNTLSAAGDLNILIIEPGSSMLRTPYPVVTGTFVSVGHSEPYAGDAYTVGTGSTLATLMLTTNGDTFWRIRDGGTAVSMASSVWRTRAYRTPPGTAEP